MRELPQGWTETKLGDLLSVRHGFAFKSKEFCGQGIPVIRQTNLTGDELDTSKLVYLPMSYAAEYERFLIKKGDILIGMSGSIGEPTVYLFDSPALQNQRVGLLYFNIDDVSLKEFCRLFLMFSEGELSSKGKGVAVQNISSSDIEDLSIFCPPLREQRRIVAKLDSLFERTRRAREELSRVPILIEHYRQAILEKAFRGELIPATPYSNWDIQKMEDMAKVGTGATPKRGNAKYYDNGTVPWVTSGAVNQEAIKRAEEYITEAALAETNCKVFPAGTLLVAMYGEGLTRGK